MRLRSPHPLRLPALIIPGDTFSDAPPRIAVIGGGITGLAAAHRVHELLPHAQLALFEAAPRLGGVLDTAHLDGFLIERSADNFLTKLPHAIDLCRRLGIADELLSTDETRRRAFVVRDGRLLPIPDGFYLMSPRRLWPLLTSPVLSLRGKLRLLAEPFIPRGDAAGNVDSHSESQPRNTSADESVASFASRRLGPETYSRLVQPLVAGIYTADATKLSMAATMPEFLNYEREHGSLLRATRRTGGSNDPSSIASGARYGLFVAPKNGMTSLISALANRLGDESIHLNTQATGITHCADGRWQIDLGLQPADRGLERPLDNPQSAIQNPQLFDAVILAVPAFVAAKLLHSCDAELSAQLSAIEYAGCAVISFGFEGRQVAHSLDGFGLVVPHVEGRRIIAASFASLKFPGRAPADSVLIRVFVGGALQPQLLDLSDADLRSLALEEISALLQITGEPMVTDICRWPHAMPQYHVGHIDRIARIEQLAASHFGLALAGNAYHGVGIPQCIATGEAAAESVAGRWIDGSVRRNAAE